MSRRRMRLSPGESSHWAPCAALTTRTSRFASSIKWSGLAQTVAGAASRPSSSSSWWWSSPYCRSTTGRCPTSTAACWTSWRRCRRRWSARRRRGAAWRSATRSWWCRWTRTRSRSTRRTETTASWRASCRLESPSLKSARMIRYSDATWQPGFATDAHRLPLLSVRPQIYKFQMVIVY